jgi:hypothetical protein
MFGASSWILLAMRLPENEPLIAAIARRLREFLLRQPGFSASPFAEHAGIAERDLRAVLAPEHRLIDPAALIDVIVEVVRCYGVDVNWILTGEYDPAAHRALAEEELVTRSQVRTLVAARLPSWSLSRPPVKFLV